MNVKIKFTRHLDTIIREDLSRPHRFAHERVGFVSSRYVKLDKNNFLIFLTDYLPVSDEDYIPDTTVGARINGNAIRKAMQHTLDIKNGMFHVHIHPFNQIPDLSYTDRKEIPPVIQNFRNVDESVVNGILLLSNTHYKAYVSLPKISDLISTTRVSVIGFPLSFNI